MPEPDKSWTVVQLKKELARRKLSVTGRKAQLLARLQGKEEEAPLVKKRSRRRVSADEKEPPKKVSRSASAADVSEAKVEDESTRVKMPVSDSAGDDLRIMCYNVNGLNSTLNKGFVEYLQKKKDAGTLPQILCLSEIKMSAEKFDKLWMEDEEAQALGYEHVEVHSAKDKKGGIHGTAVLSSIEPLSVTRGINNSSDDDGRALTFEFDTFYLVHTYVPNAGEGLKFMKRRETWNKKMTEHVNKLRKTKPVMWTGDLNVAVLDFDVYDGETNRARAKSAGFTPQERSHLKTMLNEHGWVDAFRKLYPKKRGTDCFTFYSIRGRGRPKGRGWRLDYFLCSDNELADLISDVVIHSDDGGMSDHLPLECIMATPPARAAAQPE
ncbi:MAG: hypothetical protein MHM6MM_001517 [Cercozoa sp. M6MM]